MGGVFGSLECVRGVLVFGYLDDLTTKNAPDACDSYWRRETAPGGRGRLGPSGKILDKSRIFAGRVKAV